MRSCRLLIAILVSTCTSAAAFSAESKDGFASHPNGKPFLNDIAQLKGKMWFGTAADIPGPEQSNKQYMAILNDSRIFGQITPTNYQKFEYTEPQRGQFDYSGGQVVIDIAHATGKVVRCHNLIWSEQLPQWLTSQTWSNNTLIQIMRSHITNLITHYGANCYSWDVVNEAFASDGTFAPSIWYNTIGAAYLPLAFQFAAQAVTETGEPIKLYYNDYGIEFPGAKQRAVVNMLQQFQASGIAIDGVGLESHFLVGSTPSTAAQVQAMQSYTAQGVEVAVTELDVRFTNVSTQTTPAGFAMQARDYYSTVAACMQVEHCIGMTVWDFDDKYSWIPQTYPGEGAADLYSARLKRKPAYEAVAQALSGHECTVCG